jgi:large subunit ribosomal protein L25
MAIGSSVHAGGLELPAGVTIAVEPDILVLHVIAAPTAEQLEADLGLPEGEQPEGAEAAPPAPAAAEAEGGEPPAQPAAEQSS